jgi:uncharacterized protein
VRHLGLDGAYSRMVLHFVHAVANRAGAGLGAVHAFTFGTRLTNITRHLRQRDVDAALAAAGREAQDWQGGTRIGDLPARLQPRLVAPGAGAGGGGAADHRRAGPGRPAALAREMERLHLSARRVVWINPLLRWDGFAPRRAGAAMLPHVDTLRAGHSVASLEALAEALSDPKDRGEKARLMASELSLYRSHLRADGAQYDLLEHYPFSAKGRALKL